MKAFLAVSFNLLNVLSILFISADLYSLDLCHLLHILVAAPRKIYDDNLVLVQPGSKLRDLCDGMCRFEGRNDSFGPRQKLEGRHRFIIYGIGIFYAARILEK